MIFSYLFIINKEVMTLIVTATVAVTEPINCNWKSILIKHRRNIYSYNT